MAAYSPRASLHPPALKLHETYGASTRSLILKKNKHTAEVEGTVEKGAYIVGVYVGGGKKGYAGVGYRLCPPESAGRSLGLYGFVCTGEGKFIAHGGSPAFIDMTLDEVVATTNNHLTDAGALNSLFWEVESRLVVR